MARIWFDTEFIDDGRVIDLISIGMIRDDGAEYYAQNMQCDLGRASPWVMRNVVPHLTPEWTPRAAIALQIKEFAGPVSEFWAYYAAYDWVALCQLYGTMMMLPSGWPKFCLDIKQESYLAGNPSLQRPEGGDHNALADARWNKRIWEQLATSRKAV